MCTMNILYRNGIEKEYEGEWSKREIDILMNNISSEKGYAYLRGKEDMYIINIKEIVSVEIKEK